MYDFELIRPASLAEAVAALASGEAQALGGGQTLLPAMKARLADPGRLVALAHLDEIKGLSVADGVLTVGAGTTHARVAREATAFPGLAALADEIGDPAVRNRGTIGGVLANNDPSACYPAAVVATEATVVTHLREIPAADFFQGMFATALDEGEIITAVRFPIPQASIYQKFIQPASHFAMVGVFVARYADRVGVGVTGASQGGVFRWSAAETALSARFSPEAVADLALPEGEMISDLHGSGDYRAHLVRVMTQRGVAALG